MGKTVCAAVVADPEMELVAAVDVFGEGTVVAETSVTIAADRAAFGAARADVVVDFTVLDSARETIAWCAANNIHVVVGTTGFTELDIAAFHELFAGAKSNAVIAPNFTIGAVLMMRFSELAAPWFESAEIIEFHHGAKKDAPSGTAMQTAQRIGAASNQWMQDPTEKVVAKGARGGIVNGVPIHSVRMHGMYAHQEVILGGPGQTLTIRHDSTDVAAYMPGVLLAVREVANRPGLTAALDPLLGL